MKTQSPAQQEIHKLYTQVDNHWIYCAFISSKMCLAAISCMQAAVKCVQISRIIDV